MTNGLVAFNALLTYVLENPSEDPLALLRLWNEGSFDKIRLEWPDVPEEIFPKAETDSVADLEENVRYLLANCPFTVRDMSGDRTGSRGIEYLAGSLVITFLSMQKDLQAQAKR